MELELEEDDDQLELHEDETGWSRQVRVSFRDNDDILHHFYKVVGDAELDVVMLELKSNRWKEVE